MAPSLRSSRFIADIDHRQLLTGSAAADQRGPFHTSDWLIAYTGNANLSLSVHHGGKVVFDGLLPARHWWVLAPDSRWYERYHRQPRRRTAAWFTCAWPEAPWPQPWSLVADPDLKLLPLCERLASSHHDPRVGNELIAQGLLLQLLGELLQALSQGAAAAISSPRTQRQDLLWKFDRLVSCDYALDVGALADHLGMSASSLTRQFRQAYGLTPGERRRHVCLVAARQRLLAEPGLSIAAVAEAYGFAHAGHFSKQFARLFGCSPSEDRRRC